MAYFVFLIANFNTFCLLLSIYT